jgi:hypothetical protein
LTAKRPDLSRPGIVIQELGDGGDKHPVEEQRKSGGLQVSLNIVSLWQCGGGLIPDKQPVADSRLRCDLKFSWWYS